MTPRTVFVLLMLVFGVPGGSLSDAATIRVPEDQPTIQSCVDAAVFGDTCSVAPGVYFENAVPPPIVYGIHTKVLLDKPITILSRVPFQAIVDGTDPVTGDQHSIAGIIVQASAHIEGMVIRNTIQAVFSRGNSSLSPIFWTAQNLIITNTLYGIGLDEYVPENRHSSSCALSNITVDDASHACYFTNNGGTMTVRNSIASRCNVGFQACDDLGFSFDYVDLSNVPITREKLNCTNEQVPQAGPDVFAGDAQLSDIVVGDHAFPRYPRCTSPVVDAGDPAGAYNDAQVPPSWGTTRNDIGAYGGPGATASLSALERQEVTGQFLRIDPDGGDTRVSWCNLPEATGSDLIRGDVQDLGSSHGDFASSTLECLANNVPGTSFRYSGVPTQGDAFWFLMRCEGCPGQGTYDSGAPSQIGVRDAEILASGNDCP